MTIVITTFVSLTKIDFPCESETFVHINLCVQGIGTCLTWRTWRQGQNPIT